jgi:Fe-S-cluster-containing hydrogenase component 2
MYRVNEATCTGCGDCVEACPSGAIRVVGVRAQIDQAVCADCGSCAAACPQGAIAMADAVSRPYTVGTPVRSLSPVIPSTLAVESANRACRLEVELLPAEPRGGRLWPTVGGALVWAARELLPEIVAAWRASRVQVSQPISFKPDASNRRPSTARRNGHRYRWGRA